MSRILLLNPPGKELYLRDQYCSHMSKADYYWPPVDLLVLSGILAAEHEVTVLDAIIEGYSEDEALARIKQDNPEWIIFITGIVSWVSDFTYMRKIYETTGCKVLASGDFLLWDYRSVLEQYPFLSGILLDYTTDSVMSYLRGERVGLHDLIYRINGGIEVGPASNLTTFAIPVPRHDLFPLNKYCIPHGRQKPFSSVVTNHGCPYKCSYCAAENIDFKYRKVENILPELDFLYSLGVKEIFFKDFTFGVPRSVAMELCNEIIKRYPGLSWICSSRVNVIDEELLILMKKAGCHTIQFGVESASQKILDENNKNIAVSQVIDTFALCSRLGVRTLAHFILGLPGETEESLRETIRLAKIIKCDYASFNVAVPLPGTTMRRRCLEHGWLKAEQEELDSSRGYPVIETPELTRERLWQLRNHAIRSFYLRPSYIWRKLLGVRALSDLTLLMREGFSLLFRG